MIERPKRAVTRFFIPLIDVLILLFCIFLLMPFMNQSENVRSAETADAEQTPSEMKMEMAGLRIELERSRKDVRKLQAERTNPAEKVSVCLTEIDGDDGKLYYYGGGRRHEIDGQATARELIDDQKRRIGPDRESLFLALLPHQAKRGAITFGKLKEYKRWFEGVPFEFENTQNRELP